MLEHSVSSIFIEDWNKKYEVCLTWLEGDEALQENLDVVRKKMCLHHNQTASLR